jgi:hypothetical protein
MAGKDLKAAAALSDDVRKHQQHDDYQRHPEQPQNNRHINLQVYDQAASPIETTHAWRPGSKAAEVVAHFHQGYCKHLQRT